MEFIAIDKDNIQLTITDNGKGFNAYKGLGLSNIKQRASLIKANYSIESQINKGTTITITTLQKN